MAESKYNYSLVVTINDNARADHMTLNQGLERAGAGLDMPLLAEQLERLKTELSKQATEREHYAALVAISDAATDAREGRHDAAFTKLKATGT